MSTVPMWCCPGSRATWQQPRCDRSWVAPRGIGAHGRKGGVDAAACSGEGERVSLKQGAPTDVNNPARAFPRARDLAAGNSRGAVWRRRLALGRPAGVGALMASAPHVAAGHDTLGEGERLAGTDRSRVPARIAAGSPQASPAGTAASPRTENPRVSSASEGTPAVGRASEGNGVSAHTHAPSHGCRGGRCLA